jgi:hypothetical protein
MESSILFKLALMKQTAWKNQIGFAILKLGTTRIIEVSGSCCGASKPYKALPMLGMGEKCHVLSYVISITLIYIFIIMVFSIHVTCIITKLQVSCGYSILWM